VSAGHKRILALDVGSRRIGLAVSDALGITAQPLPTLNRTSKRDDLAALQKLVTQYDVGELVLGLPLHMSGDESGQSGKVRALGAELEAKLQLPVHYLDERLTSAQAHRLLDEAELSRMQRKGKVDRIAATLILEAYLSRRGSESS